MTVWTIQSMEFSSVPVFLGFPCGSTGKQSACNEGDLGSISGLARSPGEGGKGYISQYSGLENSMDSSPWGCKDSDMTEWLSLHFNYVNNSDSLFCMPGRSNAEVPIQIRKLKSGLNIFKISGLFHITYILITYS